MGIDISIHAAREGGDLGAKRKAGKCLISIHAAREGGDGDIKFLRRKLMISIHAAREGGDDNILLGNISRLHFNPRRP